MDTAAGANQERYLSTLQKLLQIPAANLKTALTHAANAVSEALGADKVDAFLEDLRNWEHDAKIYDQDNTLNQRINTRYNEMILAFCQEQLHVAPAVVRVPDHRHHQRERPASEPLPSAQVHRLPAGRLPGKGPRFLPDPKSTVLFHRDYASRYRHSRSRR